MYKPTAHLTKHHPNSFGSEIKKKRHKVRARAESREKKRRKLLCFISIRYFDEVEILYSYVWADQRYGRERVVIDTWMLSSLPGIHRMAWRRTVRIFIKIISRAGNIVFVVRFSENGWLSCGITFEYLVGNNEANLSRRQTTTTIVRQRRKVLDSFRYCRRLNRPPPVRHPVATHTMQKAILFHGENWKYALYIWLLYEMKMPGDIHRHL